LHYFNYKIFFQKKKLTREKYIIDLSIINFLITVGTKMIHSNKNSPSHEGTSLLIKINHLLPSFTFFFYYFKFLFLSLYYILITLRH